MLQVSLGLLGQDLAFCRSIKNERTNERTCVGIVLQSYCTVAAEPVVAVYLLPTKQQFLQISAKE